MLISTYASACHRSCIRRKLAAIDVEAVLVLREGDNEVRCSLLQRLNVDRLVERRGADPNKAVLRAPVFNSVQPKHPPPYPRCDTATHSVFTKRNRKAT